MNNNWNGRLVENHLEAAAETMRRQPTCRPAAYYNTWPSVLRDDFEMRGTDDGLTMVRSFSPSDVTAAEQILLWLRWLEPEDQKIVWWRSDRRPWKYIMLQFNMNRTTVWRRWKKSLHVIADELNRSDATPLQQIVCNNIGGAE
jgi:hypothetical protein